MCCTLEPAILTQTYLLAHSLPDGRNVIGYQNQAKNRSWPRSPNAMILPFPSASPMSRENCLDMSEHPKLFHDYWELLRPRTRGGDMTKGSRLLLEAQVFDSGSYTVVLAADARAIPGVIDQVPKNKRPRLHPELFEAYALWYPGWSIALCCWDGEIEAEPLLWWYEPLPPYRDVHFLPGLDGHDGRVPDPSLKSVLIDHTIIVGFPEHNSGATNASRLLERVGTNLRSFLPTKVRGGQLPERQARNGDWVLPKDWGPHNPAEILARPRVPPPGFGAA